MDPRSVNDLDPKIKETYDRIMGNAPAQPAVSQATPPPSTPPQPAPQPATSPQTPRPQSILEPPVTASPFSRPPVQMPKPQFESPLPPPPRPFQSTQQNVSSPTMVPVSGKNTYLPQKPKRKIPAFVWILVGVVFFIIYGAVCAKIFGFF